LDGELDIPAVEQALYGVVQRHEALRYTFSADGREIHVTDGRLINFVFEDISGRTAHDQEQYLLAVCGRDAEEPFDLLNGPLFRMALFKLASRRHLLKLTAHHIVCDGWSFGTIVGELAEIYRSKRTGA